MPSFFKPAKKSAQRLARAAKKAHQTLKSPVHPDILTASLSLVIISSLLTIGIAFAQDATSQSPTQASPASSLAPITSPPPGPTATPPQAFPFIPPYPRTGEQNQFSSPSEPSGQNFYNPNSPGQSFNPGPNPAFGRDFGSRDKPGFQARNQDNFNHSNAAGPQSQNFEPEQSKQQQQMDEERLKMMKGNLSNFTRQLNQIKNQIKLAQKQGLSAPDEVGQAVAQLENVANKTQSAQSPEELELVMADMQTAFPTVQEWLQKLPGLLQLPKFIKQAQQQLSKADKILAGDERKIKSAQLNLNDALEKFKAAIAQQRSLLEDIKQQAQSDPEAALERLDEDFFPSLDNMWEPQRVIEVGLNLKKGLSQMARELKEADRTIKNLQRKKIDTSELSLLLDQAKAQFGTLKNLAQAQNLDTDAVTEALSQLFEAKQKLMDKLEDLTNTNEFTPAMPEQKSFEFNLPPGFSKEPGN